jgi:hypothetical protein
MSELLTVPSETSILDDFRAGRPGVYPGVPFRDYIALDAVSSTLLKAMRRSPAHALAKRDEPQWSDALMLGDATHLMTLQPERFGEFYIAGGQCEGLTGKGARCSRSGER